MATVFKQKIVMLNRHFKKQTTPIDSIVEFFNYFLKLEGINPPDATINLGNIEEVNAFIKNLELFETKEMTREQRRKTNQLITKYKTLVAKYYEAQTAILEDFISEVNDGVTDEQIKTKRRDKEHGSIDEVQYIAMFRDNLTKHKNVCKLLGQQTNHFANIQTSGNLYVESICSFVESQLLQEDGVKKEAVKYFVQKNSDNGKKENKEKLTTITEKFSKEYMTIGNSEKTKWQEVLLGDLKDTANKHTLAFRYLRALITLDEHLESLEQEQSQTNTAPSKTNEVELIENFKDIKQYLATINAKKDSYEGTDALIKNITNNENLLIIEKLALINYALKRYNPGKQKISEISVELKPITDKISTEIDVLPDADAKEIYYSDIIELLFSAEGKYSSAELFQEISKHFLNNDAGLDNIVKYKLIEKAVTMLEGKTDEIGRLFSSDNEIKKFIEIYNGLAKEGDTEINKSVAIKAVYAYGANKGKSLEQQYKLLSLINGITEDNINRQDDSLLGSLNFFNKFDFEKLLAKVVYPETIASIIAKYKNKIPPNEVNIDTLILAELSKNNKVTPRLLQLMFYHKDATPEMLETILRKLYYIDYVAYGNLLYGFNSIKNGEKRFPAQREAINNYINSFTRLNPYKDPHEDYLKGEAPEAENLNKAIEVLNNEIDQSTVEDKELHKKRNERDKLVDRLPKDYAATVPEDGKPVIDASEIFRLYFEDLANKELKDSSNFFKINGVDFSDKAYENIKSIEGLRAIITEENPAYFQDIYTTIKRNSEGEEFLQKLTDARGNNLKLEKELREKAKPWMLSFEGKYKEVYAITKEEGKDLIQTLSDRLKTIKDETEEKYKLEKSLLDIRIKGLLTQKIAQELDKQTKNFEDIVISAESICSDQEYKTFLATQINDAVGLVNINKGLVTLKNSFDSFFNNKIDTFLDKNKFSADSLAEEFLTKNEIDKNNKYYNFYKTTAKNVIETKHKELLEAVDEAANSLVTKNSIDTKDKAVLEAEINRIDARSYTWKMSRVLNNLTVEKVKGVIARDEYKDIEKVQEAVASEYKEKLKGYKQQVEADASNPAEDNTKKEEAPQETPSIIEDFLEKIFAENEAEFAANFEVSMTAMLRFLAKLPEQLIITEDKLLVGNLRLSIGENNRFIEHFNLPVFKDKITELIIAADTSYRGVMNQLGFDYKGFSEENNENYQALNDAAKNPEIDPILSQLLKARKMAACSYDREKNNKIVKQFVADLNAGIEYRKDLEILIMDNIDNKVEIVKGSIIRKLEINTGYVKEEVERIIDEVVGQYKNIFKNNDVYEEDRIKRLEIINELLKKAPEENKYEGVLKSLFDVEIKFLEEVKKSAEQEARKTIKFYVGEGKISLAFLGSKSSLALLDIKKLDYLLTKFSVFRSTPGEKFVSISEGTSLKLDDSGESYYNEIFRNEIKSFAGKIEKAFYEKQEIKILNTDFSVKNIDSAVGACSGCDTLKELLRNKLIAEYNKLVYGFNRKVKGWDEKEKPFTELAAFEKELKEINEIKVKLEALTKDEIGEKINSLKEVSVEASKMRAKIVGKVTQAATNNAEQSFNDINDDSVLELFLKKVDHKNKVADNTVDFILVDENYGEDKAAYIKAYQEKTGELFEGWAKPDVDKVAGELVNKIWEIIIKEIGYNGKGNAEKKTYLTNLNGKSDKYLKEFINKDKNRIVKIEDFQKVWENFDGVFEAKFGDKLTEEISGLDGAISDAEESGFNTNSAITNLDENSAEADFVAAQKGKGDGLDLFLSVVEHKNTVTANDSKKSEDYRKITGELFKQWTTQAEADVVKVAGELVDRIWGIIDNKENSKYTTKKTTEKILYLVALKNNPNSALQIFIEKETKATKEDFDALTEFENAFNRALTGKLDPEIKKLETAQTIDALNANDMSGVKEIQDINSKKTTIKALETEIVKYSDDIISGINSLEQAKQNLNAKIVELFKASKEIKALNNAGADELVTRKTAVEKLQQEYINLLYDVDGDKASKQEEINQSVANAEEIANRAIAAANAAAVGKFKENLDKGQYTKNLQVLITGGKANISETEIASLLVEAEQPKANKAEVDVLVNGIVNEVKNAYKELVSKDKKEERFSAISDLLRPGYTWTSDEKYKKYKKYEGALTALLQKEKEFLKEIASLAKIQANKDYGYENLNLESLNIEQLNRLKKNIENLCSEEKLNALNILQTIQDINLDDASNAYYKEIYKEQLNLCKKGVEVAIVNKNAEEHYAEKDLVEKIKAAKDIVELMGKTVLGPYINDDKVVVEAQKAAVSKALADKFMEIYSRARIREFNNLEYQLNIALSKDLFLPTDVDVLRNHTNQIIANTSSDPDNY